MAKMRSILFFIGLLPVVKVGFIQEHAVLQEHAICKPPKEDPESWHEPVLPVFVGDDRDEDHDHKQEEQAFL